MQLSAWYLRGKSAASGQGDFYEVIPLAGGQLALVVGAVGAQAREGPQQNRSSRTSSVALARSVLRATVHVDATPSLVLAALNRALLAWPAHDRGLVGAVYALVRPTRLGARVWVCAAGKLPAFVRRADGSVLTVGQPRFPLGLAPDLELRDERVVLRAGDSLTLVTRSVTEAIGAADRQAFGIDRLCGVLAELGGASAARSVGTILHAVWDFCGGQPDRRAVAVVLKVPGNKRGPGTHSAGWPGTRDYLGEAEFRRERRPLSIDRRCACGDRALR